jgi:hypothetical protein
MSETQIAQKPASAPAPLYLDREFKFSFKRQTVKDELGIEQKRPPVTLTVPIPTYDGLLEALSSEDPKIAPFILDLVEEAIKDQIRTQISDEDKPVNRQEDLDLSKLTIQFIANLPKSERTGGGISKEAWEEWSKDYIETMVPLRAVGGITKEDATDKVTKAAKLMTSRFNPCKTDKPVLTFLRGQLAQWASNTKNLEDHGEIFNYLDNKASDLLARDLTSQLASL